MEDGSGFGSTAEDVDIDPSIASTTDVELLKRAWRNEKAAPEILQFESSLVQRAREQIQLMYIHLINDCRSLLQSSKQLQISTKDALHKNRTDKIWTKIAPAGLPVFLSADQTSVCYPRHQKENPATNT